MILISHRGNTHGKNTSDENKADYLEKALSAGFDVEIDVRVMDGLVFLGHDHPTHRVELRWLEDRKERLWVHCKNLEALDFFSGKDFNHFWHQDDWYTLTSKGFIWAYPCRAVTPRSIAVLPEMCERPFKDCAGVCSDFVASWL